MKDEGEIWFRQNWKPKIDQVVVNLEADGVISGGVEYQPIPSIILSWLDSPFDLDGLLGRSIHIPQSYDEVQQDHVTDFYYDEHLDLDDVHIDFVERDGKRLRVKVIGKAIDPEATGPDLMDIEIDTVIRFVDRNTPPVFQPPRIVEEVGTFNQTEYFWKCEREFEGCPIVIRLSSSDDSFDKLASYARSLITQKQISLSVIRQDIRVRLSELKWKFDAFHVTPDFDVDDFCPDTFTICTSDDKMDSIHLYVFLTHPASGTDNWILRYADGECYSLEWIPDR